MIYFSGCSSENFYAPNFIFQFLKLPNSVSDVWILSNTATSPSTSEIRKRMSSKECVASVAQYLEEDTDR